MLIKFELCAADLAVTNTIKVIVLIKVGKNVLINVYGDDS